MAMEFVKSLTDKVEYDVAVSSPEMASGVEVAASPK